MEEQQPIRVAHIVGKMVGGGVETFIMNYYRNIDRAKIQFDFIIDSDSTVIPREEIENLGGKIIEISPYQKIFSYLKELKKVLEENKYKIVHSHLNALSVFPLFAAFLAKVPVRIAHSHSTTNKREWKKNIIKNILKPFSKIFATNYFACSEHAARWLFGNNSFEQGNVKIIHNAIDVNKFKYNENIRNKLRKELQIEDKFVIGHVGRFVKQKNHDFLIDLFNKVYRKNKDACLILIGEGPLEKEIKDKVERLGLQNVVLFLGIRNDVNEMMQAMDVFVFPSLYEGLGIVVVETQCSGLFSICSTLVPKEVQMTDNVEFCDLKDINRFVELIVSEKTIRKDFSNEIKNAEYDIIYECLKLEKIYFDNFKIYFDN